MVELNTAPGTALRDLGRMLLEVGLRVLRDFWIRYLRSYPALGCMSRLLKD